VSGGSLPRLPRRLSQLRWSTWRGVVVRSGTSFMNDNCTDWAAALTYYSVLALFPGAIVIIALVSLVADGPETVATIVRTARDVVPNSVINAIQAPLTDVLAKRGSAKILLSFGVLGAVWSASGFVGAFTRASNAIYGVPEGRKWYVLRPLQIGLTVVSLILLAAVVLGLVVSGPVAETVGRLLHVGSGAMTAWQVGKWPLFVLIAVVLLSLLFWIAPNVQQPRLRWLTVGGVVALLAWLVVSLGFGLYVANFASYDATYGSLGAIVVFLVWLYLSNCALMFGVEVNAELARGRALQAGRTIEKGESVLPPRAATPEASDAAAQEIAAEDAAADK
jgi:membrane protein